MFESLISVIASATNLAKAGRHMIQEGQVILSADQVSQIRNGLQELTDVNDALKQTVSEKLDAASEQE